jgi:hypothetical protein
MAEDNVPSHLINGIQIINQNLKKAALSIQ